MGQPKMPQKVPLAHLQHLILIFLMPHVPFFIALHAQSAWFLAGQQLLVILAKHGWADLKCIN
eukprot:scaffold34090_cov14-Tisochrysis_lutea.AAC.1